jgi:ABC-type multidrug transport system fused ATPase/permease subunit
VSENTGSWPGWQLLIRELTRQRKALIFLAAWSVAESLPALLSGILVAAALDQGFIARRPLAGFGWLGLLGLTIAVQAVATRGAFPWMAAIVEPLRNVLVSRVVNGALERAVNGLAPTDGAAVARLSGQAESVRNLVAALLRTLRSTTVSMVLALAGLVALAPVVAAVTAPLVALSLALFAWSLRMLAARRRAMLLAQEDVAKSATQVFEGLRDVVACGGQETARDAMQRAAAAEARATIAVSRAASLRTLIVAVGAFVPVLLVLGLAPWLLRPGRLTAGQLVGAVTYLTGTLDPALRGMTGILAGWGGQLNALLRRIAETGPASPAPAQLAGRAEPRAHDLRISGLTFSYGPHADPVVKDLSLDIPAGQHLAIVGPSGIGKSTLARLITGLTPAQHRTIALGGLPLEHISPAALRRAVALIPQEAYVFTGTLRENLGYLNPQATAADLDRAAGALGMRPLVDRLGGYDARLGLDGPALSAGESQLIALARVYVSAAAVIVMDEATCHLDPASEARAEQAIAATGRTLIVIAHRISSAMRAQRILLLNGTDAVAGSHEELITRSGLYAELVGHWDRQPPAQPQVAARG